MSSPDLQEKLPPARIKKRSFLCRIILSMALTYFLILALIFLAGLMFSRNINQAISSYYGPEDPSPYFFRWFVIAGAALYTAATAGIILFLLKRKVGFYLFFVAALIIFSLDLAFLNFDWLRYLIHTGFIFILGIAHFSRRCYN
ncbi:MAG: hypothetical protein WC605_02010 [Bacteroidales bacterium]